MSTYKYKLIPGTKFEKVISYIAQSELKNPQKYINLVEEVDLTAIDSYRKKQGEHKPSYTSFIIKAAAHALKEHPLANRRRLPKLFWPFFTTQVFSNYDIAIAIERDIPNSPSVAMIDIIRDADQHSIYKITEILQRFSKATSDNNVQWKTFSLVVNTLPVFMANFLIKLSIFFPANWVKYRGGAVLVSSPAKYGAADIIVGAWPSPIGISFGYIKERVIAKNGTIVVVPTLYITMSFDRTLMAGAPASKFFGSLVHFLENFSE